jgi:hypothetical protein
MIEVIQSFLQQNPVTEGAQNVLLDQTFGLTFTTKDGVMEFTKTRDTEVSLALDGRRFIDWVEVMKAGKVKPKPVEKFEELEENPNGEEV